MSSTSNVQESDELSIAEEVFNVVMKRLTALWSQRDIIILCYEIVYKLQHQHLVVPVYDQLQEEHATLFAVPKQS